MLKVPDSAGYKQKKSFTVRSRCADLSHAANLRLPLVLVQACGAEVTPPLEQH
jgi:hypothetical protein